jgi:hypothetical protein
MQDAPEKALGSPKYGNCRTSSSHSWRLVLIFIHLLAFYFFRPPFRQPRLAEKGSSVLLFVKGLGKEMFCFNPKVYITFYLQIESLQQPV